MACSFSPPITRMSTDGHLFPFNSGVRDKWRHRFPLGSRCAPPPLGLVFESPRQDGTLRWGRRRGVSRVERQQSPERRARSWDSAGLGSCPGRLLGRPGKGPSLLPPASPAHAEQGVLLHARVAPSITGPGARPDPCCAGAMQSHPLKPPTSPGVIVTAYL